MKFNFGIIINILGILLLICGVFMFLCFPFSIYFWEGDWLNMLIACGITLSVGFAIWFKTKNTSNRELKKRDGYLIVSFGWLIMSLFGTLPYILTGTIPNFTDAFFETVSGFTTTGASIITDIESVPKAVLLWRSLTQWIGGMGIIVLAVAILPILGIGGMQLFVAEAPGISPDKLQPRIKETAKRLWLLYVGLTAFETVLLMLGGLSFFDALNHGLTTMATGGFSTKNDSVAAFSPYLQYVIITFMFLAGTNFTMTYLGLNGNFKKVWQNEEFRKYLWLILYATGITAITIFVVSEEGVEKSFRDALFQVVAVTTTTGFVTADYTSWAPLLTVLFFLLMFVGGMSGSTAGGVKIVRHIVLFKNSLLELKRQVHPNAVIPVRLNRRAVSPDITYNILAFIMIYLFIFGIGTLVMAMMGVDFKTALGSVATSIGNIGPGLGEVGPVDNFAGLKAPAKMFLAFLMLMGRLELFTFLMLFTPYFWRRY